jgi:carboxylate-amine ligase
LNERLHLFEGYGVELEYMIVDREFLTVCPIADRVLEAAAGSVVSDVELGDIAWSNELVLHVIEIKGNGPVKNLGAMAARVHQHVGRINAILDGHGARLMPTGSHPWMDPVRETRLWPHEYSPIYEAYDRIFGCSGHGWSNLQSMHLNLPFCGDEEFGRLHAAIRLLMPIMPALTASTPVLDGRSTGFKDSRMEVYRHNSQRIPSVAGEIIPEAAYSRRDYERLIFEPMYVDIAPLDPEGTLRHEFLNSRGAIARFERNTIEIRVLDTQECPRADLAAAWLIAAVLQRMASQVWSDTEQQKRWGVGPLSRIFLGAVRDAESAVIENADYLKMFGFPNPAAATAGDLWHHLLAACTDVPEAGKTLRATASAMLSAGSLSSRILKALGGDFRHGRLHDVYTELCVCLAKGELFGVR